MYKIQPSSIEMPPIKVIFTLIILPILVGVAVHMYIAPNMGFNSATEAQTFVFMGVGSYFLGSVLVAILPTFMFEEHETIVFFMAVPVLLGTILSMAFSLDLGALSILASIYIVSVVIAT